MNEIKKTKNKQTLQTQTGSLEFWLSVLGRLLFCILLLCGAALCILALDRLYEASALVMDNVVQRQFGTTLNNARLWPLRSVCLYTSAFFVLLSIYFLPLQESDEGSVVRSIKVAALTLSFISGLAALWFASKYVF